MTENYQTADAKNKITKLLATAALVLALAALVLAVKANKRADEAFNATLPVTQQPTPDGTTNNGASAPPDAGVNRNGNSPDQGSNDIPTGSSDINR